MTVALPFVDRASAGRLLGARLAEVAAPDPVVLALPRGGVPVGYHVALAVDGPLDVAVVRKLGVPFQPELAMGAIGEHGVRVLDVATVSVAGVSSSQIDAVDARERSELERRVRLYRGSHPSVPLAGRTALIVDDGIATGSTARAACLVAAARGAAGVIVAAPVASRQAVDELGDVADLVVVLARPEPFVAVGRWYRDFTQTSDDDVADLLAAAAGRSRSPPPHS